MRILITGGAGFLGSHLCDAFLELGHEVICMDNLLTGNPDNIGHLMGNPHELSVSDIANMVLKLTESPSRIEFKPLPADDPKVRRPDISKTKELLGGSQR